MPSLFVFLRLDSFARKAEATITQPPQAVDAQIVTGSPKARAQKEAGENEPGLLIVLGCLRRSR